MSGGPPSARAPARDEAPIDLTIAEIGALGDGVGTADGRRIYVPLALPGDRVRVQVVGSRPGGLAARVVDWLDRPGPRSESPCPHFGACGGCALQHLADDAYAGWKVGRIAAALARANVPAPVFEPLSRTPPGTRRRAELAARRLGAGWTVGFHGRDSGAPLAIGQCPVLRPELEGLLRPLESLLAGLTPRQRAADIAVLAADGGIDLLLTLSVPPDLPGREALARFAGQRDLARIAWRKSPAGHPEIVAERRPVRVRFAKVDVDLPPGAFLQASSEGEQAIVAAVRASIGAARRVADLYAGAGTLTFPLLAAGATLHAVEGNALLAEALGQAARRAGLGAQITTATRDLVRRPLLGPELQRFDAVVLDPPRAGAAAQAREIARAGPPLVVAVSCNPVSFAADARTLVEAGYRLERLWPIDQFLWSAEVELVAALRRVGPAY